VYRDPGIAVGVLSKDHLVVVLGSSRMKRGRNGIDEQAADHQPPVILKSLPPEEAVSGSSLVLMSPHPRTFPAVH
jgi:hypothetical protein